MAKKKDEKPARVFTRRQRSHWQKEKKRRNIIRITGIIIIAVAILTVGIGWYFSEFRPLNKTVMRVNDTDISMGYFVKAIEFYRGGQPIPNMYLFADEVVKVIERNELVRQKAESMLGISVSNSEVGKELKGRNPPVSKDYREFVRAQMLMNKLRDDYFEQKIPISAEQRQIMAIFLEDESQANEVRARLEAGEDFAELASELSQDNESKNRKGNFGWQTRDVLEVRLGSSVLGGYAFSIGVGGLSALVRDGGKDENVGLVPT